MTFGLHIFRLSIFRLGSYHIYCRVKLSSPAEYFSEVEEEDNSNLCTWSGELYLEMHNGTYTTLGKIKLYNRRCESLLHSLELVYTLSHVYMNTPYPYQKIDELWKCVLLNQVCTLLGCQVFIFFRREIFCFDV